MKTFRTETPASKTAVNGLAVVGFLALVVAGMWLAVYSTRFVPTVVNRIGSAAVYLGSVFTPAPEPTLSVISTPVASTTISFGTASSTVSTSTTTTTVVTTAATNLSTSAIPPKKIPITAGTKTSGTYQIGGTATAVTPYGLPDLAVTISAIGYFATASDDSFVTSQTVPAGNRPAVKFTIKNIGTNWTGTWRFSASIPTQTTYVYQSDPQQSLAPGDSIDYVLGFDRANIGSEQNILITANFDNMVADSNPNNNSISTAVTTL